MFFSYLKRWNITRIYFRDFSHYHLYGFQVLSVYENYIRISNLSYRKYGIRIYYIKKDQPLYLYLIVYFSLTLQCNYALMKWLSVLIVLLICTGYIALAFEIKTINPKYYTHVIEAVLFSLIVMGWFIKKSSLLKKRNPFQIFN